VRERWKALRCLEYPSKGGMSSALTVDLAGVQKTKWAERTVSEAPKATLRRRMGLTRLHGPIRVKRSGFVKGVKDGQERQALLA
jgi:hypothetical protein